MRVTGWFVRNQAQLKQQLVDDYGTAIKTIAVHVAPLLP
jgi:hypothetical protein